MLKRLRKEQRQKHQRSDNMFCRHNLGTVNGFCAMCGKLVFIVPLKYNHKLRRIVEGVKRESLVLP